MFKDRGPIRSLLSRKRFSKPRTRSTTDPYTTEELTDIVEQVSMGFETVQQFMIEISAFVGFEVSEFTQELQDTINELQKHF